MTEISSGEPLDAKPFVDDSKGLEIYGIKGGKDFRALAGFPGGPATLDPGTGLVPDAQLDPDLVGAPARLDDAEARLDTVEAGQAAGMLGFATKAALDADLAHADGTLALVTNDATTANNATYRKSGASGSGTWVLSTDRVTALSGNVAALSVRMDGDEQDIGNLQETDTAIKQGGTAKFSGDAVYPLLTDAGRRVLLGYDVVKGQIMGAGIVDAERSAAIVDQALGSGSQARYSGDGGVVPLLTDANRKVLLGYDVTNARIIGVGLGAGGSASVQAEALPESDKPLARAVNHMLFYGQSLSVGAQGTPVISIAQPYSNLTFHGGPRGWDGTAQDLGSFKPLVEDSVNPAPDVGTNRGETPCSGAANFATTLAAVENGQAPTDHVILASTAGHGGWTIAQLKKGTSWYTDYFLGHVNAAKAINSDYAVHTVDWVQGENDSGGGTTFAAYRGDLEQLQVDAEADIKAITGQTSPVFFLTYQTRALQTANPDPALAQLDLAQKNDRFFMVTPIYHMPRDGDGTHLTATGYKWLGAYFGRAYKQLVIDGIKPRWLNPVSATRRGTEVRIRFDVPVGPMVLDTANIAAATDYGFAIQDTVGAVGIEAVAIDGSDVVITLDAAPTGDSTVRYALDYLGAGLSISNGASGNLRDSAPESISVSGAELPLHNLAPAFSLPIIALGE